MIESKEAIITQLGEAYKLTREDIGRLEYVETLKEEWVKVFNRAGEEILQICVTGDSGATMLMDVAHAINSDIVMGGKKK
ncbi:hypothetical protein [uncultured Anaerovibrio sp.]|uniref:hypothetical protein n=1 Tax=uncultured Anaerovibrio sp. TaxID=361586 RepID=UPI00261EF2DC|nr:hypothetical protein [uncultured Anaerovibrio sp.]